MVLIPSISCRREAAVGDNCWAAACSENDRRATRTVRRIMAAHCTACALLVVFAPASRLLTLGGAQVRVGFALPIGARRRKNVEYQAILHCFGGMRRICGNDEEASCLDEMFARIADVLQRATQDKTELLILVLMAWHRTPTLQLELRGGHGLGRNVTAGEQRRELLDGDLLPADFFSFHAATLPQALLRQELELFIGERDDRK